jgi:TNF receptor-associated factor 4
MKIKCDNADNGCEWIGELRTLDEHMLTCDYAFLSCPNECLGGDKILRKDIEKHKMEECPRRQYVCPHCEESGEYEERMTTHLDECPLMKIPCSNEGCCCLVARCELASHHEECEFEVVPCKYAKIGCAVEFTRQDLKKHEEDRQQHLEFTVDAMPNLELQIREQRKSFLELQETVKKQENMSAQLQSIIIAQSKEINALKVEVAAQNSDEISSSDESTPDLINQNTFKFTKYAEHKSNDDHVFSPPFYSSPGGYKLCIKVHANGIGEGKGTHLSVYAYLMRGDNDDYLPWPFAGIVKVNLLNQRIDDNHHSRSIRFGKSDRASKRVEDGDRAITGHGQPTYILQSRLGYRPLYDQQYLRNDCLYFRITVTRCKSIRKPWLSTANVF